MFANGPGDLGSIPSRVIPKTQKMVLDTSLLNTQHYKVWIKGKVEQSREGVATSPTPWCSKLSKREPSGHPRLWSPSFYFYIYIYIYQCAYVYLYVCMCVSISLNFTYQHKDVDWTFSQLVHAVFFCNKTEQKATVENVSAANKNSDENRVHLGSKCSHCNGYASDVRPMVVQMVQGC